MSKRIIFSDLHLEEKSASTALEVLRRIPVEAKRLGCTKAACLGDVFMVRHEVQVRLLNAFLDELRGWSDAFEEVDFVVGNHDQDNTAGRNVLEVFDALRGFKHFRVHSTPTWTSDGLWLPWQHRHESISAAIGATTPKGSERVLFAHLAARGALMNNLKADDEGFDVEALSAAKFKRVFLGHYHKRQLVAKGIEYVGSPYQVSYAEAGQPKGFVTWDGERSEFHEWRIGARHHKIVVDADHPSEIKLGDIDKERDKVWVVCKGQMAGTMRDVVAKTLGDAGLKLERLEVDMQPTSTAARMQLVDGEGVRDMGPRYVAAQDVPDDYKAMLIETWRRIVG